MERPRIIAHRGASIEAPENTLAAFALAARQGATMWELDLRRTADGQLVVFHDRSTERFERPGRVVATLTLAELQRLDVGSGERIPTLAEVCALAREQGCELDVELKERGCEAALIATLRDQGALAGTLASSFAIDILQQLWSQEPLLRRALLMGPRSMRPHPLWRRRHLPALLRGVGAYAWAPHRSLLIFPWVIRAIRREGFQIYVWTVNRPRLAQRLAALGAEGLITDLPGLLSQALQTSGPEPPVPG
jgi:glycerophosphoryl diester phosphodiesterase